MRTLHRVGRGLRALLRGRREDADLRDELRAFFEASVEAKIGEGLSRADAERAARLELGSTAAVEDWVRDVGWEARLGSVMQDIRYAVRTLRRSPRFALAAITTLGIGLGATVAMFTVVNSVLLRPLDYPDGERILEIRLRDRQGGTWGVAAGTIEALRALPEVAFAAGAGGAERTITGGAVPLLVSGSAVTEDFFDVLGIRPALGRTFGRADAAGGPAIVLSYELWQRAFAQRADIVGSTIGLNGVPHQVLGVLGPGFRTPQGFSEEYWILRRFPAQDRSAQGKGPYDAILRLRSADDAASLRTKAAALLPTSATDEGLSLALVSPLQRVRDWYGRILWSLLAAVGIVLLLCCANAANLLLARARTRAAELSIRGAIGASRGRIARQLITEAVVLAVPAAALGLLIAGSLVRTIPLLPTPHLSRLDTVSIDARIMAVSALLALATVLIFGVGPALVGSRHAALRSGSRTQTGRGTRRTTQLLIGFEIAATVALLVGAALVGRRIGDLIGIQAGFETRDLRFAAIRPMGPEYRGEALNRFYAQVLHRIRERAGLEAVLIDRVPLDMYFARAVRISSGDKNQNARMRVMSAGALSFIGVPLLRGRELVAHDTDSAVVNETLARQLWGDALPLGEEITLNLDDVSHRLRIVGISGNVRDGVYRPGGPELYVSSASFPAARASIVIRSGRPIEELTDTIRLAVMDVDPRQAISPVTSITELTMTYTALSRFVGILLAIFAGLATLLAITGILAVAGGTVTSRRREIGIRVAIGAAPSDVLALLSRELVPAVAVGAATGIAVAASLVQVLRWLVPGVAQFDPVAYGVSAAVVALIAVTGAWMPARRALAIAPTLVLSVEER